MEASQPEGEDLCWLPSNNCQPLLQAKTGPPLQEDSAI